MCADHLGGSALLVFLNDALRTCTHCRVRGGDLVSGDLLVRSGMQVAAADVGDVADPGFLSVVPEAQQSSLGGVGVFHHGEDGTDQSDAEAVLGDGLRVFDSGDPQPERFARLSIPISSRKPAVPSACSAAMSAIRCPLRFVCDSSVEA